MLFKYICNYFLMMKLRVYEAAEDSLLLAKHVREYAKNAEKILDMGTGSGIQAETARKANRKAEIDAADINEKAVQKLKKKKLKINAFVSDLFSNVKEKYDLIIFNPPYLPDDEKEDFNSEKWSGGKEGIEITLKFLRQAKAHLEEDGKILLVYSTLANPEKLIKEANKLGYDIRNLDSEEFFYEKIYVAVLFLKRHTEPL